MSLENADWRVELEPATLAVQAQPKGEAGVMLSQGVASHAVSDLRQEGAQASWQWDDGKLAWQASLQGRDLLLSARAKTPGRVAFWNQPPQGRGLMLPLAEGSYIPTGDERWQRFLPGFAGEGLNTTENLSLPLWGVDYGRYGIHLLLLEPFNNLLQIRAAKQGLQLLAGHDFTTQNLQQPLQLLIHLSAADPLAGAKRYRAWLQAEGRFTPLADKIRARPDTARLLGASHIYLWGNGLVGEDDVRDWPAALALLRGPSPLAARLRGHFDVESVKLLRQAGARPDRYQRQALLAALNQALAEEARAGWMGPSPDWEALPRRYAAVRAQVVEAFGPALQADAARWGGGLSVKTVERLQAAGLPRLWLGVDNWEGGLWQPQAVAAGVKAGYLMGSYDSYETALPPGEQPDWLTAQMGAEVYRQCGIMLADGQRKSGFQDSGYYTSPECVRPVLQQRAKRLQQATGFNSWFLDAYATGMVFDDHAPGRVRSQREMAAGNEESMAWAADALRVPVGSENGNAVTTRGLTFAHGMQTLMLDWGDKDMHRNPASPYFLGKWYPAEQPGIFFKRVKYKSPYRELAYAAQYRLPLYQAVFHDSVVTTNHWLFDNLKLSNAYADMLLAQWLYNVPPLFHLSAGSLSARLPYLQAADRVFRPLHQRLATQALTGFDWLSADRLLQRTRFADGSVLAANFSAEPRTVQGETLPPQSLGVWLPGAKVEIHAAPKLNGGRGGV